MSKKLLKGCEAVAEAAVLAGCRFFAGYPITPQNDIPEYLSNRLPEVGGTFIQGESEVASINMVYGAASVGVRAMTSSSGPGISLKSEGASYLSCTMLPALIVDVTRGGPGLGSIQPAQSDYFQLTKALGHGGYHSMCFAPESVQEIVDLTYHAFDYAERDRNPVIMCIDGCLGAIMEQVELPEPVEPDRTKTDKWSLNKEKGETRDMHRLSPYLLEPQLEQLNKMRAMQYKSWQENDVKYEEYSLDDAEYVVIAYGISARVCKEAIDMLRAEGVKIGLLRPITLVPFPKKPIANLDYGRVKAIVDVELAIPAQMRDDIELQVKGRCSVYEYGRTGGILFDDESVCDKLREIISEVEKNG